MTWRAPEVTREPVPRTGDEPTMLAAFLDGHRLTLRHKCAGLTAEQLAARTAEPSIMSLLGLVRHMAEVERAWFRRGLAGEPRPTRFTAPEASPMLTSKKRPRPLRSKTSLPTSAKSNWHGRRRPGAP